MSFPKPMSRRYDNNRNRYDHRGNRRYDNRGRGYGR
jgi:hypothetical protein